MSNPFLAHSEISNEIYIICGKKKYPVTEQVVSAMKATGRLNARPQGEWIPVSERLPEDGQEILFSTKTGRVHSGKYHDDDSDNQWYSFKDQYRAWNNVVIAWQPLLEPYKEKEE